MPEQEPLVCWRCGAALTDVPVPVSRQAYCPQCRADLHVCRMCEEYDPKLADQCRAELDDVPHQKERANFCDHFSAAANAYRPEDSSKADAARAQLESLFGAAPPGDARQPGESKADAARRQLQDLFGDPKRDDDKP